LFGLASILFIFSTGTWAGDDGQPGCQKPQFEVIELIKGKTDVLEIPCTKSDHFRITVVDQNVADFINLTKAKKVRRIYIKGLEQGATTLTLWKNGELFCIYDVHVYYDVSLLKRKLHDILPDEKDIRIFSLMTVGVNIRLTPYGLNSTPTFPSSSILGMGNSPPAKKFAV